MTQYTEPIHRWCSFSDSWPPSAVNKIVSLLAVDRAEWIWDPFGGAGTTAVVAATRGIRSITSDIDPLAVLVAKIKTDPPSEDVLERSVWHEARSLEQLFGDLAKHSDLSRSVRIRTMRFLVAVSLLRSRWHLGETFDDTRIRTEFSRLRSEMLSERAFETPMARALVYRGDFLELVPLVRRLSRGQAVMITSPPFPGSNDNPKLLKLERALGLLKGVPSTRKSTRFLDYRRMLDAIVCAAAQVGCRAVAAELSTRRYPSGDSLKWPPDLFGEALERFGYLASKVPFDSAENDPSILCLGIRTRN